MEWISSTFRKCFDNHSQVIPQPSVRLRDQKRFIFNHPLTHSIFFFQLLFAIFSFYS